MADEKGKPHPLILCSCLFLVGIIVLFIYIIIILVDSDDKAKSIACFGEGNLNLHSMITIFFLHEIFGIFAKPKEEKMTARERMNKELFGIEPEKKKESCPKVCCGALWSISLLFHLPLGTYIYSSSFVLLDCSQSFLSLIHI